MAAWIAAGAPFAEVLWLAAGILLLVSSWIGWGYWTLRPAVGRRCVEAPRVFDCAVAGLGALFAFGFLANQFTALGPWTGDAAMAVGLAGCARFLLRRRAGEPWRAQALIAVAAALYLAAGIRCVSLHYDSGLYHLPFIEWLRAGPLPLGLANLHVRFGYFSSWFVVAAAEGASRLHPDLLYLMNGAAGVAGIGALAETALPAMRTGRWSFSSLFSMAGVVLAAAAAHPIFFTWMGASPSPDVPAAVFTLVALARLSEWLERPAAADPRAPAIALWAAALAVTVKVSQWPALLAAAAVLLWTGLPSQAPDRRKMLRPAAAAAALLAIWEAGGLLISGCLLFPVSGTCVAGIPWSADPARVAAEAARVTAWARAPGRVFEQVQEGWQWAPHWWELMWPERPVLVHLLVAGAALLLATIALRLALGGGRRRPGEKRAAAVTAATSLAAVAATALTAPDPRFCLGFLIALPAAAVAWLAAGPARKLRKANRAAGAALALLIASAVYNFHLVRLCGEGCAWRRLPVPPTHVRSTAAGLEIKVPADTDQCWSVPPPCSPEFSPSLRKAEYLGRRAFLAGNGTR